jgi:uncharacterized membrane protein
VRSPLSGDAGVPARPQAGASTQAIAALEQYGGTVIKTSLSEEDTKKLQEALQAPEPAGAS